MYHQSKFKFAAALLVAGHCATPAIAIANTNSNSRVQWMAEDDTNNDITVYNTKPGLRNGNMMTESTSVPSSIAVATETLKLETATECEDADWFWHPDKQKCVRGMEATGISFGPKMEKCCTQAFGEDVACDWYDACNSSSRASSQEDANINTAYTKKNIPSKIQKKTEMLTKSGKTKSGKDDGLEARLQKLEAIVNNCLGFDKGTQTCSLGSDDINFVSIKGKQDIDISSLGDVDIDAGDDSVGGDVFITAKEGNDDGGDILIRGEDGEISIDDDGITIITDDGDINLLTDDGDITLRAKGGGDITLLTDDGDINLRAYSDLNIEAGFPASGSFQGSGNVLIDANGSDDQVGNVGVDTEGVFLVDGTPVP